MMVERGRYVEVLGKKKDRKSEGLSRSQREPPHSLNGGRVRNRGVAKHTTLRDRKRGIRVEAPPPGNLHGLRGADPASRVGPRVSLTRGKGISTRATDGGAGKEGDPPKKRTLLRVQIHRGHPRVWRVPEGHPPSRAAKGIGEWGAC